MLAKLSAAGAALFLAAASSPDTLAGKYSGQFDGGDGDLTISGAAPRYRAVIDVGTAGCGGGVEGPLTVLGPNRMVLTAKADNGDVCTVAMTRDGARWNLLEDQCLFFHGAACGFTGSVSKAGR